MVLMSCLYRHKIAQHGYNLSAQDTTKTARIHTKANIKVFINFGHGLNTENDDVICAADSNADHHGYLIEPGGHDRRLRSQGLPIHTFPRIFAERTAEGVAAAIFFCVFRKPLHHEYRLVPYLHQTPAATLGTLNKAVNGRRRWHSMAL